MLCAIGYHAGDIDQAWRLADWMRILGPYPGHTLLVARDSSTTDKPFEAVGFDSVQEIAITDDRWKKWPESPNNVFRKLAKHIEYAIKTKYWLFLEPDCAPISRDWLDVLEAEFKRGQKPFMGARVTGAGDSPEHMSGIGFYPGRLTSYAGKATIAMEIPWDLEAADQIRPKAHFTNLIAHNWRPPTFSSLEEMRAEIPPSAVLYHKDKTGNLIGLLRQLQNLPVPALAEERELCPIPLGPQQARESAPSSTNDVKLGSLTEGESLNSRGGQNLIPWASKLQSEEAIKRLAAELKTFCTAPVYTGKVRRELKLAGVIK